MPRAGMQDISQPEAVNASIMRLRGDQLSTYLTLWGRKAVSVPSGSRNTSDADQLHLCRRPHLSLSFPSLPFPLFTVDVHGLWFGLVLLFLAGCIRCLVRSKDHRELPSMIADPVLYIGRANCLFSLLSLARL